MPPQPHIVFTAYDSARSIGGPMVNARRLLPELQKRGYRVSALIPYYQAHPNVDLLREAGIHVETICQDSINWFTEPLCEWILEKCVQLDPDVYVPNMCVAGGYAARWIRESGRPTVISHRSDHVVSRAIATRFGVKNKRWACSGIMVVNEFLRKEILQNAAHIPATAVIPSGVPLPEEVADQSVATPSIVYAGRFVTKAKQILETTEAILGSLDRHPELTATFMGNGDEEENVRALIASSPHHERVRCIPAKSGAEYQAELRKHQIIVLLSDFEGTPGALMDGMASGLVPIAHQMNGINDLVQNENTGLVVADRNDAFQAAVDQLVQQPGLRGTLAANARAHIEEQYSLKATSDRWAAFIDQLLSTSPGEKRPIRIPRKLRLPAPWEEIGYEDLRRDAGKRGAEFGYKLEHFFDR